MSAFGFSRQYDKFCCPLKRGLRSSFIFAVLLFVFSDRFTRASATTIDPLSWQQLVDGAGFVGIVECTKAGGIVAEYRVMESWKGVPPGSVFRIRIAVNYWEPQFPMVLVGQKYLVTVFKNYDPTVLASTTSGGPVPLWWRNIPADYSTPLFQGMEELPLRKIDRPLGAVGSDRRDLASFKKDVQDFLGMPQGARELTLLKKLAAPRYPTPQGTPVDKERASMEAQLAKATSVSEFVSSLFAFESRQPKEQRFLAPYVLGQAGGAETLRVLQQESQQTSGQLSADQQKQIVGSIRRRLGIQETEDNSRSPSKEEKETPPSTEELARIRKVLASHPDEKQFFGVFEVGTKYEPSLAADYLIQWENKGTDWRNQDMGYVVGSYYAKNCSGDRRENLTKLLNAKDEFVRVAGAVYLTFEDRDAGTENLKRFVSLSGDAGAWAALVLTQRGDKSEMPRALEVLSKTGDSNMAGVPHRNLQKRLVVLLSNSASANGLDQLPLYQDLSGDEHAAKSQAKIYEDFRNWWKDNQDKIILSDPWVEILDKQKVD